VESRGRPMPRIVRGGPVPQTPTGTCGAFPAPSRAPRRFAPRARRPPPTALCASTRASPQTYSGPRPSSPGSALPVRIIQSFVLPLCGRRGRTTRRPGGGCRDVVVTNTSCLRRPAWACGSSAHRHSRTRAWMPAEYALVVRVLGLEQPGLGIPGARSRPRSRGASWRSIRKPSAADNPSPQGWDHCGRPGLEEITRRVALCAYTRSSSPMRRCVHVHASGPHGLAESGLHHHQPQSLGSWQDAQPTGPRFMAGEFGPSSSSR
jgi:hypothetical protein